MSFAPFLRWFALSALACVAVAAAIVASAWPDLPAPHLSRSPSFNEKARWLRAQLAGSPGREARCDVLAVGSSMTLNSLDAARLARPGERAVNLGSFGVNPEDTVEMLPAVLARCRPRLVVMATYHGDFANPRAEAKDINWPAFSDYVRGGSLWRAYGGEFDPYYLIERSLKTGDLHRTDTYQSMAFDAAGGVGLACSGFHRDPARWDGDLKEAMAEPRPQALAAMSRIGEMARAVGARLVVIIAPLRPRAEAGFHPQQRAALWHAAGAAVAPSGGILLRPAENASFTDADFADFAHLNRCGRERWSGIVSARIAEAGL